MTDTAEHLVLITYQSQLVEARPFTLGTLAHIIAHDGVIESLEDTILRREEWRVMPIEIDEAMMGSEWNPDADSLADFGECLEEITGRPVVVCESATGDDVSGPAWNAALDLYTELGFFGGRSA